MGVEVVRQAPPKTVEPILTVILQGPGLRSITIRPNSGDPQGKKGQRTVELRDADGYLSTKWTAMLGDLRTLGQALLDIADGK